MSWVEEILKIMAETKQIFVECINPLCLDGMEIYTDFDGKKGKHRVSFEVPIGMFIGVKKGQLVPDLKCRKCKKETLIRD